MIQSEISECLEISVQQNLFAGVSTAGIFLGEDSPMIYQSVSVRIVGWLATWCLRILSNSILWEGAFLSRDTLVFSVKQHDWCNQPHFHCSGSNAS